MPQYSACNETHYEWVITVATGLWADIYDDARVDQYQYNKLQAAPIALHLPILFSLILYIQTENRLI